MSLSIAWEYRIKKERKYKLRSYISLKKKKKKKNIYIYNIWQPGVTQACHSRLPGNIGSKKKENTNLDNIFSSRLPGNIGSKRKENTNLDNIFSLKYLKINSLV